MISVLSASGLEMEIHILIETKRLSSSTGARGRKDKIVIDTD